MAGSDSLFGATGTSNPVTKLTTTDQTALDKVLSDMVGGTSTLSDFNGGTKLITGDGAGGEKQGALLPNTNGSEILGQITTGTLTMNVDIPAGVGITFSGKDAQTAADTKIYMTTAVASFFTPAADPGGVQQTSLKNAVDDLLGSLGGGKDISVRLIDFLGKTSTSLHELTTTDGHQSFALLGSDGSYQGVDSLAGSSSIILDAGTSAGKQLFAINLANASTSTILLSNIEAAALSGAGTVKGNDSTPIRISSDNAAQNITGGSGADTLIGTGNDTMAGGLGNDIFGISGTGKYTITDFNKLGDLLYAGGITGVTNIDQLHAKITSVVKTATSVTYNLGPDTSVTLVGVTAADLTAAMIKFTLS